MEKKKVRVVKKLKRVLPAAPPKSPWFYNHSEELHKKLEMQSRKVDMK